MNKIMYNGKEVLDIDVIKDKYTKAETDAKVADKVKSNTVKEIKVVTEYPQVEETGVLYIKVEPDE